MTSKDSSLYGVQRQRKLAGGKEISSSSTLSFTSQLSSLINSASNSAHKPPTSSRTKTRKDDIFTTHNRNTAKRAKRDLEDSPAFVQKHTTNGEALDRGLWERSKRKMEEKARLYAAMKRGDVEDLDERYAVDFDKKWAEKYPDGQQGDEDEDEDDNDDDAEESGLSTATYIDEFGRSRTGTAAEAARAEHMKRGNNEAESDRFTARPSAPSNIILGDTIQHHAFNPDEPIAAQMEELARRRDKSLTPPPDAHFDGNREIRTKGTGFFQFSGDAEERKRQMEGLKQERTETERRRNQSDGRLEERRKQLEARRKAIGEKRGKRKADDFLEQLGEELSGKGSAATDVTDRIEEAVAREEDED